MPRLPISLLPALLLTLLASPCTAAEGGAPTAQLPAWLAGHWCDIDEDGQTEEVWLSPAGGQMLGMGRSLRNGRMVSFEFLRIGHTPEGVAYLAQPNGRPPTAFRLDAGGENWARFENPGHDFPTRIAYRREGDTLHAQIAGPGQGGEERRIGWRLHRCEGLPPSP